MKLKMRFFLVLYALLLVLLTSSCLPKSSDDSGSSNSSGSSNGSSDSGSGSGSSSSGDSEDSGSTSATTTGTISIYNSSNFTITAIYVWEETSSDIGTNQLGSSTLAPSDTLTLTDVPEGWYYVKVITASGEEITSSSDFVEADLTLELVVTISTVSIGITNNTGESISSIYLATSTASSWGSNRLATDLANGSTIYVNSLSYGTYQIEANWGERGVYSNYSFDAISGLTTLTAEKQTTGTFNLANATGYTIYYIYVVQTSYPSWGTDLLGTSNVLLSGYYTALTLYPGKYAIKVIFSDATYSTGSATVTAGGTTTLYFY